jgi:hypothetical protein
LITGTLQHIKDNLNSPSYSSSEYLSDLQTVQDTAKKYAISSDILNELIGFVNAQSTGQLPTFPPNEQTPTPTVSPTALPTFRILIWTVGEATGGWMFITCIGAFSLLSLVFYVTFEEAKDKSPSKYGKIILAIPLTISILVVTTLLTAPPDNFQPTLAQASVIGAVVVGLFILALFEYRKSRKKVTLTSVVGDSKKRQSNNNPDQEP